MPIQREDVGRRFRQDDGSGSAERGETDEGCSHFATTDQHRERTFRAVLPRPHERLTEELNAVYDGTLDPEDAAMLRGMRERQHRMAAEDPW